MTTTTAYVSRAAELLHRRHGMPSPNSPTLSEADVNARLANAAATQDSANALHAIAAALKDIATTEAPTQTPQALPEPWPANVTARLLTRIGIRDRNPNATVDIHDDDRTTARCRPCGWGKGSDIVNRRTVLESAQDHANQCTAIPKPTA